MKTIVIYASKYGATRQYAQWLGEALECEITDKPEETDLSLFDTVIFGGGLYAGGINGVKKLQEVYERTPDKKLYLFTVGLADPKVTDYSKIKDMSLQKQVQEKLTIFHLRGRLDYSKLNTKHRLMMWMMKKMTQRKKEKDEQDRLFLESYGKKPNFLDKNTIAPIVSAIKGA